MVNAFCHGGGAQVGLHRRYVKQILDDATALLKTLHPVQHVPAPTNDEVVTVVGDLHGSLSDLGSFIRPIAK